MAKVSPQKSDARFSRFVALSLCGWILTIATLTTITFKYKFNINFETSIASINSYLTLYQQKDWILNSVACITILFLLVIYVRILSFKTFTLIKIVLLLAPTLFIISLSLLIFNLHQIITVLKIPSQQNVFVLTKFMQSFSMEEVYRAIATLPYQLNSIKYPFYGVVYSYLTMFGAIILFPLMLARKTQTLWRKLNFLLSSVFLGAFSASAYYLTIHVIQRDPFIELEQILSLLSSL